MDDRDHNINHSLGTRRDEREGEQSANAQSRQLLDGLVGISTFLQPLLHTQAMCLRALADALETINAGIESARQQTQNQSQREPPRREYGAQPQR